MIHDYTAQQPDTDDSVLLARLADTDAVLFTISADDEASTYALIRAPHDVTTDAGVTIASGDFVVYYADAGSQVYIDPADVAILIPPAAYGLI